MLCKRTVKNQITLPKKIASLFQGIVYFNAETRDGKIILSPVEIKSKQNQSLSEIRKKMKTLGLKKDSVHEAIRWARRAS